MRARVDVDRWIRANPTASLSEIVGATGCARSTASLAKRKISGADGGDYHKSVARVPYVVEVAIARPEWGARRIAHHCGCSTSTAHKAILLADGEYEAALVRAEEER